MRLLHHLAVAAALLTATLFLPAQSPAPAMQKPADERAWLAATALADPAARLAALDAFITTYPQSKFAGRAHTRRFHLLLDSFPDRAADIRTAAKAEIIADGKGLLHLEGEAEVAEHLAEAGPNGVLLPEAAKWAADAEHHLKESRWTAAELKTARKYHATQTPAELHTRYLGFAANIHLALADVDLHQGKLDQAKPLLDQAFAAQPADITTNALRGEYALAIHNRAEALTDFERAAVADDTAELFSDLATKYRPTLLELYREANHGSDTGLEATLDTRYHELFPAPFTPAKPTPIPGGHTALLELFTGSGCPPCVGADLAAETLLTQYPRANMIVLSFDQHIPRPDPLATPDSVARAAFYKHNSTPTYALDGTSLEVYGARRDGAADLYSKLEHMATAEAATPSNVTLTLTPSVSAPGNIIHITASVTTGSEAATTRLVSEPKPTAPPPTPEEAKVAAAAAKGKKPATPPARPAPAASPAAPPAPKLVINFALVEDDLRYSGENGLRFHRMVVRALARPADSGFPLAFARTGTADATFDPATVTARLDDYLASYARSNERFGPLHWRSTPTALNPRHLVVVAWVQDLTTHRILQSAVTPPLFAPATITAQGATE